MDNETSDRVSSVRSESLQIVLAFSSLSVITCVHASFVCASEESYTSQSQIFFQIFFRRTLREQIIMFGNTAFCVSNLFVDTHLAACEALPLISIELVLVRR